MGRDRFTFRGTGHSFRHDSCHYSSSNHKQVTYSYLLPSRYSYTVCNSKVQLSDRERGENMIFRRNLLIFQTEI